MPRIYPTKKYLSLVCETCHKPFLYHPRPSDPKFQGPRRFCSRKCHFLWFSAPLEERFRRRIGKTTENGCILWVGAISNSGYGHIAENGTGRNASRRNYLAHRLAWEMAFGPVPEGLWVLHHCDVRICINVEHLFLGTVSDNCADMVAKGRSLRGERSSITNLTDENVLDIRNRYAAGTTQSQLAREYGITQSGVSCIVLRKCWKHLQSGTT